MFGFYNKWINFLNQWLLLLQLRRIIRKLKFSKIILQLAYINKFDVCIILYKINKFTEGISLVKLFEYLAFGKPVVATDLPSLRDLHLNVLIKIAKTKDKFEAGIAGCLLNDPREVKNRRIEFARNNTWAKRIEEVSNIIIQELAK